MKANEACGTSRRTCLKVMAAAAGGLAAGAGGAALVGRMGPAPTGPFKTLTAEEAQLVDLVCEQIIPADKDPGAHEAGVVYFIDKQLRGPYKRFLGKYRKGLKCLQQTSLSLFQKPFEALPWPEQTRLLQALESGKAPKDIWTDLGPQSRSAISATA
jgi:hypothetical protein